MYHEEIFKQVEENKLSAQKVSEKVHEEYGVSVHKWTIQCEVAAGGFGISPLQKGNEGNFTWLSFQHLVNAFESYVQIKQLNG